MTRDELRQITLKFTDAFNRDDLDGVMAWFAEDAVYDEFHGVRHEGKEAIRAAFEPMFAGKFGKVRFEEEDLFLDAERWQGDDFLVLRAHHGGALRAPGAASICCMWRAAGSSPSTPTPRRRARSSRPAPPECRRKPASAGADELLE